MSAYIKIIRPFNLLLVALTQGLIYYFIIVPVAELSAIPLLLTPTLFALLIIDTVIIAAAGYVINDIFDYEVDKQNHGTKTIVGQKITIPSAWIFYELLAVTGMIIAFYVAYKIDHLSLSSIYFIATGLLFLYSLIWKQKAWIGNIVVSLFTAMVPFILIFAERAFYFELDHSYRTLLSYQLGGFIVFAFITNMIREIVKDQEDQEGDQKIGYRTAAIVYQASTIRAINLFLLTLNLIVLLLLFFKLYLRAGFTTGIEKPLSIWSLLILIIGLHLYTFIQIWKAKNKKDFHQISTILKLIMLLGLILFIVL